MSDQSQIEVYKALRHGQDRYTYFLLAAAGATIALVVNQTREAPLNWSQLPLALAVLSWALSFFCGCQHLRYVSSTLYANVEFFRIMSGKHAEVGNHPQAIEAAAQGIRRAMETNSDRGNRYAHWQFRLLLLGASFYLIWHVYEMYLRTP